MKKADLQGISTRSTSRGRQAGLTLTEAIGAFFLLALVVMVGYKMYLNQKEKRELLDCMSEMRGVHASTLEMSMRGSFVSTGELWELNAPGGAGDGAFCYVTEGSSTGEASFVLVCRHDHGSLGKYVYLTEDGVPMVATDANDPDYRRLVEREGRDTGPAPMD